MEGPARRRVPRVMREHGLLAPHRAGRTKAKSHDGTNFAPPRTLDRIVQKPNADLRGMFSLATIIWSAVRLRPIKAGAGYE